MASRTSVVFGKQSVLTPYRRATRRNTTADAVTIGLYGTANSETQGISDDRMPNVQLLNLGNLDDGLEIGEVQAMPGCHLQAQRRSVVRRRVLAAQLSQRGGPLAVAVFPGVKLDLLSSELNALSYLCEIRRNE